jgi:hypothetical protein
MALRTVRTIGIQFLLFGRKDMSRTVIMTSLMTVIGAGAALAQAAVIIPVPNGDFQSPDIATGTYTTSGPDGWAQTGTAKGIQDVANEQFVYSNSPNGSLTQLNIGSTVTDPGTLKLTFDGWKANTGTYTVTAAIYLDNTLVASQVFTPGVTQTNYSLSYNTTASDINKPIGVGFLFSTSVSPVQAKLDNVAMSFESVPEPAAFVSLTLGLCALLARRRM